MVTGSDLHGRKGAAEPCPNSKVFFMG